MSDRGVPLWINTMPITLHVDSESSTLYSHIQFVMTWTDTRLRWDPENYENMRYVNLPHEKIWTPEIMVYNSVEHFNYEKTEITLDSWGTVRLSSL